MFLALLALSAFAQDTSPYVRILECDDGQDCDSLRDQLPSDVVAIEDGPDGISFLYRDEQSAELLAARQQAYARRVLAEFGPELTAKDLIFEQKNAPRLKDATPPAEDAGKSIALQACFSGYTDDGEGGCKLIFGTDSRAYVSTPLAVHNSKFAVFILDTPFIEDEVEQPFACSATFVDETHLLIAAHCLFDTAADEFYLAPDASGDPDYSTGHGTDLRKGYVCLGGLVDQISDFTAQCEFVASRGVSAAYQSATSDTSSFALDNDFAILTLQTVNHANGLGYNNWLPMSSINTEATLETKIAVSHGYPGVTPASQYNHTYSYFPYFTDDWNVWSAYQYRTSGVVSAATTTARLRTKLESGGGQSGSSIFYYTDDTTTYTGQSAYIIGLISYLEVVINSDPNDDYVAGPTVGQFRTFINGYL